jgi:hypothetical protein
MDDHSKRFDCLEAKLEKLEKQMNEMMEMVAVGKGALVAAKVLGWVTATAVAAIELWRTFFHH